MLSPLRQTKRYAKNLTLFRSSSWARAVHPFPVRFNSQHTQDMSKGLYLPEADAYIPCLEPEALAILRNLYSVNDLRERVQAKFSYGDRGWNVELKGMKFKVRTDADFGILWEIFVRDIYAFHLPTPPTLIIDIGMNFGTASHFFAHQYGCSVHAFEIFPKTHAMAEEHFARNPEIASKVTRHCVGLGAKDEELMLPYDRENLGGMGVFYVSSSETDTREKVQVAQASRTLGAIIDGSPKGPVVAKIDCEGSEFPILRDLAASGVLNRIDLILMEWHAVGGPLAEMIDILVGSGFSVVAQEEPSREIGYVYASRFAR